MFDVSRTICTVLIDVRVFFQTSSPVWEDFLSKSLKLHTVLR